MTESSTDVFNGRPSLSQAYGANAQYPQVWGQEGVGVYEVSGGGEDGMRRTMGRTGTGDMSTGGEGV